MQIGDRYELEVDITAANTAQGLCTTIEERFPEVLATAKMIALMELAAARLMAPLLEAGELSVGVHVNVTHIAPVPAGALVTVSAEYLGKPADFYEFEVRLEDAAGIAGAGTHGRAIVAEERLLQGAARRR